MDSAADLDVDNDQLPDFRLLLTPSRSAAPSLPNKAIKCSDQQGQEATQQTLEDQHDAFYRILQEERSISEKNLSRATYNPSLGLFLVTVNKGGHFNTMGHTRNGQVYAFPEEALFLVDRGSLMVQHHGMDVTVQQMWALFFESERISSTSSSACSSSAMDRYQVYAYLKRLGFIVTRPEIYKKRPTTIHNSSTAVITQRSRLWDWWNLASRFVAERATSLVNLLHSHTSAWKRRLLPTSDRPLVPHDTTLCYTEILQSIRITPTSRLAGDSTIPEDDAQGPLDLPSVDFEVYKPGGSFKKREPGVPDFRVVVARAGSNLPSLSALKVLLKGQIDPDLTIQGESSGTGKGKAPKPNWPNLIYGIVNGAQVTFLRIANEPATLL